MSSSTRWGLTLAFRSTCPRQGELPAGWLFFRTAALFTGTGPSASLVSQLDRGEFSRARCLHTGDCEQRDLREVHLTGHPAGSGLFIRKKRGLGITTTTMRTPYSKSTF